MFEAKKLEELSRPTFRALDPPAVQSEAKASSGDRINGFGMFEHHPTHHILAGWGRHLVILLPFDLRIFPDQEAPVDKTHSNPIRQQQVSLPNTIGARSKRKNTPNVASNLSKAMKTWQQFHSVGKHSLGVASTNS